MPGIKKKKRGRPSRKSKSDRPQKFAKRGRPRKEKERPVKKLEVKYSPKILRGMQDIMPDRISLWEYFLEKAEDLAEIFGFQKVIPPILEEKELFVKTTGSATDIVKKQMYEFQDLSGTRVALRPEITPSIARIYIEHGMFNLGQPVKLYYWGPCFRYERPQSGRFRQFYQFGLEVLGSASPIVDAQLITFTSQLFARLGLKIKIQLNSLGCAECRKSYRQKLVNYFKAKKKWLCPICRERLVKNPLRILDCKEQTCRDLIAGAPQFLDSLCGACHEHFVKVLEFLDAAGIIYELNPYLVRGLDYYTRTVFEILPALEEVPTVEVSEDKSFEVEERKVSLSRQALGGGGRYDTLLESLGGRPTPACGLSYGIERIVEELRLQKVKVSKARLPRIFLAQLGEKAKSVALKLSENLRKEGFRLAENFSKDSLRSQLEIANKLGVKFVLILGQQEVIDKTIIIRDMASGNQEVVDQEKIVKELRKRLSQIKK